MIPRTQIIWTCSVVIVVLTVESLCIHKTTVSKNWGPQSMLYLKGKHGRRYVRDSDDGIYKSGLKNWYSVIKEFRKLKTVDAEGVTQIFTLHNVLIHYTE